MFHVFFANFQTENNNYCVSNLCTGAEVRLTIEMVRSVIWSLWECRITQWTNITRALWQNSQKRNMATLTKVFPCLFLSCKANARVKSAKTGHGPHSSWFLCCCMYCLFCVVLCIVCVYMCTVLLPPGCQPNCSKIYHIVYHIIPYIIVSCTPTRNIPQNYTPFPVNHFITSNSLPILR